MDLISIGARYYSKLATYCQTKITDKVTVPAYIAARATRYACARA